MKKTYMLAMAIAAGVSVQGVALAQDYQIEGGLSYSTVDFDAGGDDSIIGLDGTYHIKSVSTSGTVLNEAAFVGRNSNINASYQTVDTADFDITDIGVEWWFEEIYAAANINDEDGFGTNTIQLGYMVAKNTLVAAIFQTGDQPEDGMGLRVKHVGELGGKTVNLEAAMIDTDGDATTMIGGDYYFSEALSVGVSMVDSDLAADASTTLSVKNFFTETISVELDYTMNAMGGTDDTMIGLRAAMRF